MPRREARSEIAQTKPNLLEPLDLSVFGGPDDPCFGKYHDLKAEECKQCGDREICAIAMAQKRRVDRTEIEKETPFKDMEDLPVEVSDERLKRYMQKKVDKGFEIAYILDKTVARFEISRDRARELYKQLNF